MIKRICFTVLILLGSAFPAWARIEIAVALTSAQPPFVVDSAEREGLFYDTLKVLNQTQEQYYFKGDLYPTQRVYQDHKRFNLHLVAFVDIN